MLIVIMSKYLSNIKKIKVYFYIKTMIVNRNYKVKRMRMIFYGKNTNKSCKL